MNTTKNDNQANEKKEGDEMVLGVDFFKMEDPEKLRGKFWNNTEFVRCREKGLGGNVFNDGRCSRCDCMVNNSNYKICYECNTIHIPYEKTFRDKKIRFFERTKYERPNAVRRKKYDVINAKYTEPTEERKNLKLEIKKDIEKNTHLIRHKYRMKDFERDFINKKIQYYNADNIESDYGVKKLDDDKDIGAYIYEMGDDIIIEPNIKNVIRMVWNKLDDLYDKVSKKENFTHIFRPYEFECYLENLITLYGNEIKLFKVSNKELEKMDNDEYDYEANERDIKKKWEEWQNEEW